MASVKQIDYIDKLMEKADQAGLLEEVLREINPDLGEDEDFMVWIAKQPVRRASEAIDILKEWLNKI
jgi:hypothetical protein